MFYNKLSKIDKEERLIKLKKFKDELEFDNHPDCRKHAHPESKQVITAWKKYIMMPDTEQERINKAWDEYYELVKKSPAAELFQAQREAGAKGNWARVKDLAEQAAEMRINGDHITLKTPSSIDPWEFQRGWVKSYLDCEQEIRELTNNGPQSEEMQEVWND